MTNLGEGTDRFERDVKEIEESKEERRRGEARGEARRRWPRTAGGHQHCPRAGPIEGKERGSTDQVLRDREEVVPG